MSSTLRERAWAGVDRGCPSRVGYCVAPFIAILACTAVAAAPRATHSTWAVVATGAPRQAGVADLLTAELSRQVDIQLVEREKLSLATDELDLARAVAAAGSEERLKLGRILGADALVCLAGEQSGPAPDGTRREGVRLVICETRNGVRLHKAWFPFDGAAAPDLVRDVARLAVETRERFRDGVKGIVAVPPFICRNLTHEQDHLQGGCAAVVETALAGLPGVAVVEFEEARSIGRELELAGTDVTGRLAPLFVEGQFESRRATDGTGTLFSITIGIAGADVPPIALQDADAAALQTFLGETLPGKVAALLGTPNLAFPAQEQFSRLAARAEMLASIGCLAEAIPLREASLLVDPQASDQRRTLINEVKALVSDDWAARKMRVRNPSAPGTPRSPEASATMAVRNLDHLEHLIRNRRLSVDQALGFFPWSELVLADHESPEKAAAVRRFLVDTYPLIVQLEPAFERDKPGMPVDEFRRDSVYQFWQGTLFREAASRFARETKGLRNADLEFLLDLARRVARSAPPPWLPERPIGGGLVGIVKEIATGELPLDESCTEAEYLEFLEGVARSPNPRDAASGRLGRFWWRWRTAQPRGPIDPWLAEANTLATQWAELFPPGVIRKYALIVVENAHQQLGIQVEPIHWSLPVQEARVLAPSAADMPAYVPLEMEVRNRAPDGSFTPAGPLPPHAAIRPCGPDLDMAWVPQGNRVWAQRRKGVFEEFWSSGSGCVHDVAWDGEHVWIATAEPVITVLSPEGAVIARVGEAQGLPPADRGLLVHAVSKDTVCAIGSFGPQQRAWCALVHRDGQAGRVHVFHEARRVPGPSATQRQGPMHDPAWAFVPAWVHERQIGDRRELVVGRQPHVQAEDVLNVLLKHEHLVVDLGTLGVSVQECPDPYALNGPAIEPHFLPGGTALVGTLHVAARGTRFPNGAEQRTLIEPLPWALAFPPRWLACAGAIWLPGASWYRVDPATLEVRRLGPGLAQHVRYAVSSHYGIVCFGQDRLYRIDTTKLGVPSTLPRDAPIDHEGRGIRREEHADRAEVHFNPRDDMAWFAKGFDHVEIRNVSGERAVGFFSTAATPRRLEQAILVFYGVERLLRRPAAIRALGISAEQVARLRSAWERVHGAPFDTNERAWQSGTQPLRVTVQPDEKRLILSAFDAFRAAAPADQDAARDRLLTAPVLLGTRARADYATHLANLVAEAEATLTTPKQHDALRRFADGIVVGPGY